MFNGKQIGNGTIGSEKLNGLGGIGAGELVSSDGAGGFTGVDPSSVGLWTVDGDSNLYVGTHTISGGADSNILEGEANVVSGANIYQNLISGWGSQIASIGGAVGNNQIFGNYNYITAGLGGYDVNFNFIAGGLYNLIGSINGLVHPADSNFVSGYNNELLGARFSAIIGGSYNQTIESKTHYVKNSSILGGYDQSITPGTTQEAQYITMLGLNSFSADGNYHNNSVLMPKVFMGLGTGGALSTTGETNMLGINSATGEVIQAALPTASIGGSQHSVQVNNGLGGLGGYENFAFDFNYNFIVGYTTENLTLTSYSAAALNGYTYAYNGAIVQLGGAYNTIMSNRMYGYGAGSDLSIDGDFNLLAASYISNFTYAQYQVFHPSANYTAMIAVFNSKILIGTSYSAIIGVDNFELGDNNTVALPKVLVGRGNYGALPTTGADYGLGYNSTTGAMVRTALPSGGSPGGIDGNIQYNNGGVFGANASLNWDDTFKHLTAANYIYPGTTLTVLGTYNSSLNSSFKEYTGGAGVPDIRITSGSSAIISSEIYATTYGAANPQVEIGWGRSIILSSYILGYQAILDFNGTNNAVIASYLKADGVDFKPFGTTGANRNALIATQNSSFGGSQERNAIIGGQDITVTSGINDTVFMPKLAIGRGTGGALPTTGETHGLGYNSATGDIIRMGLHGVDYDAPYKNLISQGSTITGSVSNSSVIGYYNSFYGNNGVMIGDDISGSYNKMSAFGAYTSYAFIQKSSIVGGSGNQINVRNDAAYGNGFYRCGIVGGYGNTIYADAVLTAGAYPVSSWIVASKGSKLKFTGAASNNGTTLLGLYDYTATDPDGHTVFMPKIVLGRGTLGALPTTGETHGLGYDSVTGKVIRTALSPWTQANNNIYPTNPSNPITLTGTYYASILAMYGTTMEYANASAIIGGYSNSITMNTTSGGYGQHRSNTIMGNDNHIRTHASYIGAYGSYCYAGFISGQSNVIQMASNNAFNTYADQPIILGGYGNEINVLTYNQYRIAVINSEATKLDMSAITHRFTAIGLKLYQVADPPSDTVALPKVRIGRGSVGALPTTGATYGLGYNGTNGEIIRIPLQGVAGANTQIQYNNSGVFGADSSFVFLGATAGITVPSGTAAQRVSTLGAVRHNNDSEVFEVRGSLLNQSSSFSRIGEHSKEMTIEGEGTVLHSSTNQQSFNLSPFKTIDGAIELRIKFIAYDSGNDLSFVGEYIALYKDLTSTATQIGTQQPVFTAITDDGVNPPVVTLDASGGSARITINFADPVTNARSYAFYYDGVFRYNRIKASA